MTKLKTSISLITLATVIAISCSGSYAAQNVPPPDQPDQPTTEPDPGPGPGPGPGDGRGGDDDDDDDSSSTTTTSSGGGDDDDDDDDGSSSTSRGDLPGGKGDTLLGTSTSECGNDVSRLSSIRISAYELMSIRDNVRLIEVCPQISLSMELPSPQLLHRGNVIGMREIIADNPAINAELAANSMDADDVIAVQPGNGATYVYVHDFGA